MKNIIDNTDEILHYHISGFHKYVLDNPIHLSFVSNNFCDMVGYKEEDLLSESVDLYAPLILAADRKRYDEFINKLTQKEQTITVQYQIVTRDGALKYVNDTATSKRLEDGTLVAYSVLTDVTTIKDENKNLQFLNETIPCGFLKYTCEKQPKITYVNDQMLNILRFPNNIDGAEDYLELCKQNVYLMIPMEERQRFSRFLSQVDTKGTPISGEITVLRCDGTKAHLYGWATKFTNARGQDEFQTVCMDITERYRTKKTTQTELYMKALSDVYDKIFEYDFSNQTVTCLYGQKLDAFKWIQNIPMNLIEATEQWIESTVVEEDRNKLLDYFHQLYHETSQKLSGQPIQIGYRAHSSIGDIREYVGIYLKINDSAGLFCCRRFSDDQETDSLRNENILLKNMNENMQELVMRFTEGIIAFEIKGDIVTPLYTSDNVCKFFGYTKEQWIIMVKQNITIKQLVSNSGVTNEEIEKLLETGEAEFTYYDIKEDRHRRIKAICSQKYSDGEAPRYVMLYNVDSKVDQKLISLPKQPKIYIRTFGYFDVFVDEKPIAFRNKKSKELFALLVDRRGGYVSSEEAISFLWEEEAVNSVTLSRYRKVALRLKNILEEYGISNIVDAVDGKRRIVLEKVQCDLYDYLSEKEEFSQLFKGSYLTNYSWGENTLGELINENLL